MSRQATIVTPFPTLAETAHSLGVSVAQAERIRKMLNEGLLGKPGKANGKPAVSRHRAPKASTRRTARYAAKKASKRA